MSAAGTEVAWTYARHGGQEAPLPPGWSAVREDGALLGYRIGPGEEREQFKALVRAFHERGIAVVIDVVPNHTGENMDDRHLLLNFNVLDLPYYYRTGEELEHIGAFGNETKSEERPMVQQWIVDQLRHWVDELGVDGFRIDLAGQIGLLLGADIQADNLDVIQRHAQDHDK